MKILYLNHISPNTSSGGSILEKRNLAYLELNNEVTKVGIYHRNFSFLKKMLNMVFSPLPMMYTFKQCKEIKKIIMNSDADCLFIDNSSLGYFAKFAIKKKMKIITFFHNCEKEVYRNTKWKIVLFKIVNSEKNAIKKSDLSIVMTKEDEAKLIETYGKINNHLIIPVSYPELYSEKQLLEASNDTKTKKGLFIGSLYYPNLEAIDYILKHLADDISCQIEIIGSNVDQSLFDTIKDNVKFLGRVDSIAQHIIDADFMLFPILSGSGMKIKTVEALMYGKYIIGSKETFAGYDIKLAPSSCVLCETKDEYIAAINNVLAMANTKYNFESRKLWETKYSDNTVKEQFLKAIAAIEADALKNK